MASFDINILTSLVDGPLVREYQTYIHERTYLSMQMLIEGATKLLLKALYYL